MTNEKMRHDDEETHHDAEKGAALGGLGGAAVGAIAGAAAGPVGAVVGAVAGGLAGAGASGAAVSAVDRVDNDNNVTGLGDDVALDKDRDDAAMSDMDTIGNRTDLDTGLGNDMPGIQTGGAAMDGTPDTRGVTEKAADTLTGDKVDDNTGKRVDY